MKFRKILLVFALSAQWNLTWGQETRAVISGTVTDPQGASVADATVSIQSASTGSLQKLQTTSTGTYSATALEPGDYVVTFEAKGFRRGELKLSVMS